MKRLILVATLIFGSVILFDSCSPKTTANGNSVSRRGDVTGNWIVTNITFEGIPDIAVKTFLGENSYKCFLNSTWNLTNSGNGLYSLPGNESCAAKTQTIFWSMNATDGTFQFKKIYEGEKPKNVTDGYVLTLASADGNSMIIKSPITYGGKTANVVMNFIKAGK